MKMSSSEFLTNLIYFRCAALRLNPIYCRKTDIYALVNDLYYIRIRTQTQAELVLKLV